MRGETPSYPGQYRTEAYVVVCEKVLFEIGLYWLPETCPLTIKRVLADDFLL